MKHDCVFCRIVAGNLASDTVYEDDSVIAFCDISPKAKTHILITPKKHIDSLMHIDADDELLMGHMVWVSQHIAQQKGLTGYKLLTNVNRSGGQAVFHIHMHLLSGSDIRLTEC